MNKICSGWFFKCHFSCISNVFVFCMFHMFTLLADLQLDLQQSGLVPSTVQNIYFRNHILESQGLFGLFVTLFYSSLFLIWLVDPLLCVFSKDTENLPFFPASFTIYRINFWLSFSRFSSNLGISFQMDKEKNLFR